MRNTTPTRKLRHFKSLSNKINELLKTGKWLELSEKVQITLLFKLKKLAHQLKSFLGLIEIKKILAAAAVLIGFGINTKAQVFNPPIANPFGIALSYNYAYPDLVDIDNDGDLDLFVSEYPGTVKFFRNTGTSTNPQFALPEAHPFGITSFYYFGFMDFADLDNDGDYDMLGFEYDYDIYYNEYGNWRFLENIGTAENPQFDSEINDAFDLPTFGYNIGFPEFADIDNDGDIDLFLGEYYGNMILMENIGSPESPIFDSPQYNPFGLVASPNYYLVPSFADLDLDNDLDLLINKYEGEFRYYENIGTSENPIFDLPQTNPFGLSIADSTLTLIDCVDMDGDGDFDIIGGGIEYFAPIYFFKNDLITDVEVLRPDINLKLNPNPASQFVHIEIDKIELSNNLRIEIIDHVGRIIKSKKIVQHRTRLDVHDLSPGIYFVKLIDTRVEHSEKLIIY